MEHHQNQLEMQFAQMLCKVSVWEHGLKEWITNNVSDASFDLPPSGKQSSWNMRKKQNQTKA